MRAYAIGDIHGHIGKLRDAHDLIDTDRRAIGDLRAPVIHVGDLVDRGPKSKAVIEFLIDGRDRGENWSVLKGNHDRMFERFMVDPGSRDVQLRDGLAWLHPALGGRATLESYGLKSTVYSDPWEVHAEALKLVPERHVAFLQSLPLWMRVGQAIFVHAGIKPGVPITQQVEDDLVWIRGEFHNDTRDHGALIVHGHTPVEAATHYGNRLNIDSGAAFGGPLSVVVIEGRKAWLLTKSGREELEPVTVPQ